MRAILAGLFLVAGCSEPAPSGTQPSADPAQPQEPGVADVRTPSDLLPQSLDPPWAMVVHDPQPAPWQFDGWATDLQIAVVFDAAVGTAQHDGQSSVLITAFQSDSGVDGPGFARSWIAAYACDEPAAIAIDGVAVTAFRGVAATALRSKDDCWPHYLLVFRDQLVVIQDPPQNTHSEIEPTALAPIVRAIMAQAE